MLRHGGAAGWLLEEGGNEDANEDVPAPGCVRASNAIAVNDVNVLAVMVRV
jgi:hypothetical protein